MSKTKNPRPSKNDSSTQEPKSLPQQPNILFIMVDQMRFPRFSYGDENGFVQPLKQIFGFREADKKNEFKRFFPGLLALRDNAVVLNNHRAASSACVPSRAAMMTGQYGTVTGVKYTDGTLKNGLDPNFPWLDGDKFPTLGDWMREAGYSTHYYGKWHCNGDETHDLEAHGFADWDLSHPDPYGSSRNNLGYYRDYQCSALTRTFLLCQGLGVPYNVQMAVDNEAEAAGEGVEHPAEPTAKPWFAVCSFNNPHDIGVYPNVPAGVCGQLVDEDEPYALAVPKKDTMAALPETGTMQLVLNRLDFPQDNAALPPTWDEAMDNKPPCQFNAAYKVGLALMSGAGVNITSSEDFINADKDTQRAAAAAAVLNTDSVGVPLALTSNPELACRAFMQYYGYLIHEVDQHIEAVLKALEESGQADNTIIVFTADHGEYGGAHHMMMEKWHTAYEECIHVPMVVRFPRSMYEVPDDLKQLDHVSSHVDLLPTILGLAQVDDEKRQEILKTLSESHKGTREPIGADLSGVLLGRQKTAFDPVTGSDREGVLFMTHDTITEPGEWDQAVSAQGEPLTNSESFDAAVEELIARALRHEAGTPPEAAELTPSRVPAPSLVHSVVSQDGWKLVRYFSCVENIGKGDHYELYDLNKDGNEQHNLLVFNRPFPTVVDSIPKGQMNADKLASKASELMDLLVKLEDGMLGLR